MKSRKINCSQKIDCGFTLIELLIAVVIVAVLATVSIISYQNYIVRENRQLAEHSLTAAASKMEQYYAQNGRYTNGSGAWPSLFAESISGSSGTIYTLSLVPSTPNAQSYAILATPQGNIQGSDGNICIDRQGNVKAIIREIRNGDFIIIAPDIDLGLKDSEFVPFFGIQTNTITTISRLAKITGADVCLMTTTLKADESGYLCEIGKPLENFPGEDPKSDTARLNQYFEDEIRLRPAEYYWVHKRFKNRPDSSPNPYNPSI